MAAAEEEPARQTKTFLLVGVVAAAVSAATVAYVYWWRNRHIAPHVASVQELLDRCHTQVRDIERQVTELTTAVL